MAAMANKDVVRSLAGRVGCVDHLDRDLDVANPKYVDV